MDDLDNVKEALAFINRVFTQEADNKKEIIAQVFGSVKEFWNFLPKFMEKYRKEEAKLPYHINLIDELHANENAHSRILAKLLQQKTPYGKYEILESFVRYINTITKSVSFEKIHIKKPDITQETERIDLWIRDKEGNYAIIIENKINWAGDQDEQLSRYIDKTIGQDFVKEQIYVIYLSPICDKMPDEQTWGDYKEDFKERFINLSYKDDILKWLTKDIMPNVRLKDKFLSSALEQYIDHIEGIFNLRTINKKMNMELQEFIRTELGLTGNPQDDIAKLAAKQDEIIKVNSQLQLMRDNAEKEIFQKWKTYVQTHYPKYQQIDINGVGLLFPVKDKTVQVTIGIYNGDLYYQVDTQHLTDASLPQEVIEKVKRLFFRKTGNNTIWSPLPRIAYDEAFSKFCEVIQILTTIE